MFAYAQERYSLRHVGYWKPTLIVDHFNADGASLDDVKWIFVERGIAMRTWLKFARRSNFVKPMKEMRRVKKQAQQAPAGART